MTKRQKVSFSIAAGLNDETFNLYGRVFYARPMTVRQLNDLMTNEAAAGTLEEQTALVADALNARIADGGEDVTIDWLLDNLTEPDNVAIAQVLRTGRAPTPN